MQFNQSIPLLSRPKYAEGSKLASSRDKRNNSYIWEKGELNSGQIHSLIQATQKLSREAARQGRRIIGGGSSQLAWPWMYPTHKEGDSTLYYRSGTTMYLSALNTLVATGVTDLVSSTTKTSCQGIWLAMQDIPAASGGKWNVPQYPYPSSPGTVAPSGSPLKGDFDNAALFWVYLGDI